jgi:hypothetical protein
MTPNPFPGPTFSLIRVPQRQSYTLRPQTRVHHKQRWSHTCCIGTVHIIYTIAGFLSMVSVKYTITGVLVCTQMDLFSHIFDTKRAMCATCVGTMRTSASIIRVLIDARLWLSVSPCIILCIMESQHIAYACSTVAEFVCAVHMARTLVSFFLYARLRLLINVRLKFPMRLRKAFCLRFRAINAWSTLQQTPS